MSKRSIEICILSARGLKRSNPLWKLKTLCVSWIDPDHKYCSKVDKSGDTHPAWNMKFSAVLDAEKFSGEDLAGAAVSVEVYSREPVFHFLKLECAAKVMLKEFIAKADVAPGGQWTESASFQLRTPAGKPRGMVDVAIRISQCFDPRYVGGDDVASTGHDDVASTGQEDVAASEDENDEEEPVTAYPANIPSGLPPGRPEDFPPANYPYSLPPAKTAPPYNSHPGRPPGFNPHYPPPPPGYNNYYYPPTVDPFAGSSYIGLPGPRPGGGQRPGQGMAVAGALAGGAAGGMFFGMDGISDGLSQFYGGGGHLSVYGDPLF